MLQKLIKNHISELKSAIPIIFITGMSMFFGLFREVLCAALMGATAGMDRFLIAYMPFDLIQPATRDISAGGIGLTGSPELPEYTAIFKRFFFQCIQIGGLTTALYMIIFWFGRSLFNIPDSYRSEWLIIIISVGASIFFAMVHAPLCTHFVNKGNVLFQASQNLWLNIGMILLLLIGTQYSCAVRLAFGIVLGSGFLLILEYSFFKKEPLTKPNVNCNKKTDTVFIFTIVFIILQAIGSKGQILVERTLGLGLPEGYIASLHYAQRFYAIPFNLLICAIVLPMVPRLAMAHRNRDPRRIMHIGKRSCILASLLIIPSLVLINIWGEPIVALLLERGLFTSKDSHLVSQLLMIYSFGAPGWIMTDVCVRILWIIGNSGLTVIIIWLGIGVYYLIGCMLIGQYGVRGMAASSAIFFNIIGLAFFLTVKHCLRKQTFRPDNE
ncbi:MAG: hypothetical protein GY749_29090 [Desulfobacteraceae bacterium]|nr:hypothetical protein [Desulfobacteraceae bacterium]